MHGFCSSFWLRSHLQTSLGEGFDSHGGPGVAAFDFLSVEAVVHWRKHPGWNKHIYVANIKRYIDPSLFKLCLDASHLPSMVLMNDSVLSSDAATLRPR